MLKKLSLIFIAILFPIVVFANEECQKEINQYEYNDYWRGNDTEWYAQTFTLTNDFYITKIRLRLYRYASPGNLVVSIRAVDESGKPTGSDLVYGYVDINSISLSYPGEWVEVSNLLPSYNLVADTKYAIVIRSETNYYYWHDYCGGSVYDGGEGFYSSDSGATWDSLGNDFTFEIFGCQKIQIFTLIENATTDAKFYLDKSFSYGDIFITIFLSIFLIFGIVKFVFNFIYSNVLRQ